MASNATDGTFTNSTIAGGDFFNNTNPSKGMSSSHMEAIISSNDLEKDLSISFILIITLISLVGQLWVLWAIFKTEGLHTPHFWMLMVHCIGDVLLSVLSTPLYVVQYLNNGINRTVCTVISCAAFSTGHGLNFINAYLAYERYVFYCKPLEYFVLMSKKRMTAVITGSFMYTTSYIILTEIIVGREYHASVLTVNLPGSSVQSMLQFVLLYIPPGVSCIYCMAKIGRLIQSMRVAPAAPSNQDQDNQTDNGESANNATTSRAPSPMGNLARQARKGLLMVAQVSGTFWCTHFCSIILRMVIFNMGYTWDDLDSRKYLIPSILIRTSVFLYSPIALVLNPLVYCYSRNDLRAAMKKVFSRNNQIHPTP